MGRKKIIYIGLLFILMVIVTVTYFSYAFLADKKEYHGKLNVVAGTLDYSIKGNNVTNNRITVEPGKTEITLKIKSLNIIQSKYQLYYTAPTGVVVGYPVTNLSTGTINANEEKEITVVIDNPTASNQTVTFGVQGGFANNTLTLSQGTAITEQISLLQTFKEQILADATTNNTLVTTAPTLNRTSAATNENGLYKMSVTNGYGGSNGDTYYFRGNVTNNVVEFANLTWRIVRINEDDTIRLILDTSTNTSTYQFNNSYNSYSYMYYSNSSIKSTIDSWFNTAITGANAEKVATGNYFCEAAKVRYDTNYSSGSASMAVCSSYTPTLDCTKDGNNKQYVSGSVGLMSYDEVVLAGGYYGATNQSYYLYKTSSGGSNNFGWWTMSPAGFYSTISYAFAWSVYSSGYPSSINVYSSGRVRPVINLKADVVVTKDTTTGHYIVQ